MKIEEKLIFTLSDKEELKCEKRDIPDALRTRYFRSNLSMVWIFFYEYSLKAA